MYIVTPYPNILYALDLEKGGTVKWKYEPSPAAAAGHVSNLQSKRATRMFHGHLVYKGAEVETNLMMI